MEQSNYWHGGLSVAFYESLILEVIESIPTDAIKFLNIPMNFQTVVRGVTPSCFLNHFSRTMVKSSNLELLTVVRLFPIVGTFYCNVTEKCLKTRN